jgi:membrane protease YdiL (CAAX protease family)
LTRAANKQRASAPYDGQIRGGDLHAPDTRPPVYLEVSEPTMESTISRKNLAPTVVGLAIALFALPVFMATYRAITGENHSNWQVLAREFAVFLLVGLLLWIVKRWEDLPLTSIGLRDNMLRTSLLRGLWFALILLVVTVGLYLFLRGVGVRLGEEHGTVFHPSLLVVTLSMLRAGVAEEVFYRGFATCP